MWLAVNTSDTWPLDPVAALMVFEELEKVPDEPEEGAVNVTFAPGTGLPSASVTIATSGLANADPWVADWLPPETTVIEAGVPATMLKLLEMTVPCDGFEVADKVYPLPALLMEHERLASPADTVAVFPPAHSERSRARVRSDSECDLGRVIC